MRLYVASIASGLDPSQENLVIATYKQTIEKQVISFIDGGQSTEEELKTGIFEPLEYLLGGQSDTEKMLRQAGTLLSLLVAEYPSVVECDISQREAHAGALHFEFIVDSREILPRGVGEKVSGFTQTLYGVLSVRSPNICYPLPNAERAQSYHLEVSAPEGFYMRTQQIRHIQKVGAPKKPAAETLCASRNAIQPAYGQRRAHLYLRDAKHSKDYEFVCMFEERTPGTAGYTTVSSVTSAFILFVCGYLQVRLSPVIGGMFSSGHVFNKIQILQGNGDIAVALLAIPPVIGVWLGMKSADRLLFGSLWSRLSVIITVATCLVGASTYIYFNSRPTAAREAWILWSVLVCVSVTNSIMSASRWLIKSRFETVTAGRASENEDYQ
ncbi:MAG: hypothetical protein FWF25_03055 [Propionibacteriaceae bacterium]|nr:hypothetical protein [Propionibacteriaceae bacterium]